MATSSSTLASRFFTLSFALVLALGVGHSAFAQLVDAPKAVINPPSVGVGPPIPQPPRVPLWGMSLNCCASASTPVVLQSAGTGGLEVAVQSFNGFAGQISISIDPSGLPNGVTAIPSVSSFYLEANQTVEIDVSITATATAFGSGSVRILGSTPDSLLVGTSVTGYLLVNPVNANPGLGAGPFLAPTGTVFGNIPVNLIPPATGTSTITLKSTNHFSGTLNLTATCCTEYLTGLTMRPEGAAFSFDSPSLALAPDGSVTTNLHIATSGAPSFGKFTGQVQAQLVGGPGTPPPWSTPISFIVLPVNETLPACTRFTGTSPRPDELRLGVQPPPDNTSALEALINEHNPSAPDQQFLIAIFFPSLGSNTAVEWRVNSGPPVAAGTASIQIVNQSATSIEVSAFNSATCTTVSTIAPGSPTPMLMKKGATTTLVFRKYVSNAWRDVGVFGEPAFWTMFSGRSMTFTWLGQ
jgi:hypothetical protein